MSPPTHIPVLLAESLELLAPRPGGLYCDATVGLGGHAEAILEASSPDGLLVGIDRDPEALALAKKRLARFENRVILRQGRYSDLHRILNDLSLRGRDAAGAAEAADAADADDAADAAEAAGAADAADAADAAGGISCAMGLPDGIILDLGVSSLQLDDPRRGFSFREPGPLDMRMDPGEGRTAGEMIAELSVDELARVLKIYGEQRRARTVARAIKNYLERTPEPDTSGLARVVAAVLPPQKRGGIHPATQAFMAIRIALNEELSELETFLGGLPELLGPAGRLVVITFHSLEDRMVKRRFASLCQPGAHLPHGLPVTAAEEGEARCMALTRKAVVPTEAERETNPRARSARLRAVARNSGAGVRS